VAEATDGATASEPVCIAPRDRPVPTAPPTSMADFIDRVVIPALLQRLLNGDERSERTD
jgi:hypothetical protein